MAEIKRTVTVFNQNTQEKIVVENVSANTFGELKTILRAKGVVFDGMDVREGISRIDLKSDSAVLPHDTPYRGGTTNDLMILMTKTNKNISSGVMGRSEAAAYIKENNLGDAVKAKYGKNWTNLSTADLVAFVEDAKATPAKSAPKPAKAGKNAKEDGECPCEKLEKAFRELVEILYEEDQITGGEKDSILDILGSAPADEKPAEKGFSQDEILAALKDM